MLIGVPKEIKDNEFRVGLIPSSVQELVHHGHKVLVQAGAGARRRPDAMPTTRPPARRSSKARTASSPRPRWS